MLKTYTLVDQVAMHLREEISRGRWTEFIPGRDVLVKELGVNGGTVGRAIAQLEKEGVLEAQGKGKRRRVAKNFPRSGRCQSVLVVDARPLNFYDHFTVGEIVQR